MNKLVILTLILVLGLTQASPLLAKETTTSAVLSAEQSSTPSGSVLEKLNSLKMEIASKAAEIKADIGRKIVNRAWSGVISSKTDSLIVLKANNEEHRIRVDEYTLYTTGKTKDKGLLKDLAIGDFIVAIGDVDDENILKAKKVIRSKQILINKSLIWGQIQNTANNSIKVRTVDGEKDLTTQTLTTYWLGSKEASISDAKKDKFLLAVTEGSGSADLKAMMIYFIPTTGYFKPEKKASPSAGLASPSAKVATKSAVKK
jgi:hypothetical protein